MLNLRFFSIQNVVYAVRSAITATAELVVVVVVVVVVEKFSARVNTPTRLDTPFIHFSFLSNTKTYTVDCLLRRLRDIKYECTIDQKLADAAA